MNTLECLEWCKENNASVRWLEYRTDRVNHYVSIKFMADNALINIEAPDFESAVNEAKEKKEILVKALEG